MMQNPIVFLIEPANNDRFAITKQLDEVNLDYQAFPDAESFLSSLTQHQLGCVFTELKLGHSTAFQLVKQLRQTNSSLPVTLLTGHATVPLAVQAFKAGFFDVLEKPSEGFQLWECATRAFEIHGQTLNEARHRESVRNRLTHLSRQELRVMQMLLDGEPNKRIAVRLGVSPRTVVFRRKSLMEKMNAKSLADLACLVHAVTASSHQVLAPSGSLLDFQLAANMYDSYGNADSINTNGSATTVETSREHVSRAQKT
jgi:two-component system response regulator FixJ